MINPGKVLFSTDYTTYLKNFGATVILHRDYGLPAQWYMSGAKYYYVNGKITGSFHVRNIIVYG